MKQKKHIFLLAGAAVLAMVTLSAQAQDQAQDKGWYIGAHGGASFPLHNDFDARNNSLAGDGNAKLGWGIGGFAGYDFGDIRLELDLARRQNKYRNFELGTNTVFNTLVPATGTFTATNGKISANSAMVNVIYDLINDRDKWQPFVGIGGGLARLNFDSLAASGTGLFNQKDTVLAGQLIAGVRKAVSEKVDFVASYRYMITGDAELAVPGGSLTDPNYKSHALFMGFSIKFGGAKKQPVRPEPVPAPTPPPPPEPEPKAEPVAPPPPPPPPEPEPVIIPGPFIVFFDWDSAELSPGAVDILRQAAKAYQDFGIARIDAIGHTDTSGPNWYNDRLSVRRAEAVQAALIRLGVRAADVVVTGSGEDAPLIATLDGVREPQNRRVEINLVE